MGRGIVVIRISPKSMSFPRGREYQIALQRVTENTAFRTGDMQSSFRILHWFRKGKMTVPSVPKAPFEEKFWFFFTEGVR
jgi:hypothetical protein